MTVNFPPSESSSEALAARSESILKWLRWDSVPKASEINKHGANLMAPLIRLRDIDRQIMEAKTAGINNSKVELLYKPNNSPLISINDKPLDTKPENPPFTYEYFLAVSEKLAKMGIKPTNQGDNWTRKVDNLVQNVATDDPTVILRIGSPKETGPITDLTFIVNKS